MRARILTGVALASGTAMAANSTFVTAKPGSGSTQVTIYNGGFATVKETRTLDLKKGENEVRMTDVTAQLETDSVVLRDLKRAEALRVLEQNYEANPLSEYHLLAGYEGKDLDFEYTSPQTGERFYVRGKLIRAPQNPNNPMVYDDSVRGGMPFTDAIVETNGKLQFGLPGRPRFDPLDPGAILKPTLLWKLASEVEGPRDVEVSYLTGGLRWEAAYNLVAAEKGDNYDLVGWVTLQNQSGKDLLGSQVKLVAGDVARASSQQERPYEMMAAKSMAMTDGGVTERSFEEYHLYSLPRPTNVMDREVKQVEFVRAANVPAKRLYVFDAARPIPMPGRYVRGGSDQSKQPVATVLEFENKESAHLGMPLPKGKVKVYRRDIDGRNEFVGEDAIDHTPKDEKIRVQLGNAFDIVGERRAVEQRAPSDKEFFETWEIKLRNHKTSDVEVRVVEHFNRGREWELTAKGREFTKLDATSVEFKVPVKANGESAFTYTVKYKL
jgi:hypothetical protein